MFFANAAARIFIFTLTSFALTFPESSQYKSQTPAGNDFNELTCCLFAPCLMSMPHLTEVELDKEPFACIRTGQWRKAGLADLPDDVVHLDWVEVIKHLARSSHKVTAFLTVHAEPMLLSQFDNCR